VTYKVSRAKSQLPSREQRIRLSNVKRSMKRKAILASSKAVSGPLLANGEFRTCKYPPPEESRFPVPLDWKARVCYEKGDLTRYEPVHLKLGILDSGMRRYLCGRPSGAFRKRVSKGAPDYPVLPCREGVSVFQRKAHALRFIQQGLAALSETVSADFWVRSLRDMIQISREIFRGCSDDIGTTKRGLMSQLHFSLRCAIKDQNHDLRSRREALSEPPTFDLSP
jgi:hypothetical protein